MTQTNTSPQSSHPASPAKVFFADLRARGPRENKITKIASLFNKAGFASCIEKNDLTAIKVHVGERGNDTFINPVFVRQVADCVKAAGGKPFITDSNTLYKGSRHNAVDHIATAIEHGFGYATVNAPFIVADGLRSTSYEEVAINKKHFSSVKIAANIVAAQSMIVLSHFKGHEMAGFGGVIKNLAMGCTPSQGKCDQHAARFFVTGEKCVACGKCSSSCPQEAIHFSKQNDKSAAVIDKERCVGCGECMTVCAAKAIEINWATEIEPFCERMAEYAFGAIQGKAGKTVFLSFLMNITPDCDCVPWSDTPLTPDIGILASTDPVALDSACYNLVNQENGNPASKLECGHAAGENKFTGVWRHTRGEVQLAYAEEIGLGTRQYELIAL
ncbi:4Fe-4S ferredoxin [Deltaproteobacteria bacterium]|nr:4Fe-4S ferredoxin [Deltaproteobacteria bacterium]